MPSNTLIPVKLTHKAKVAHACTLGCKIYFIRTKLSYRIGHRVQYKEDQETPKEKTKQKNANILQLGFRAKDSMHSSPPSQKTLLDGDNN